MQVTINYVNQFLVFGVFAITLNLLIGYGGIFSAAQTTWAPSAATPSPTCIVHRGWSFWPALLLAIAITAVASVLVGLPALRLEPLWLVLLTLAVQIVISNIPNNVPELGGTNGILVNKGFHIFGFDLGLPTDVFPVLLICLLLVFALSWRVGESPYGRVLKGIRDDQVATRSLGRNVYQYKLTLFAITGVAAGLGGVMFTLQTNLASPSLYSFAILIEMISMVIIGGMGNLWGSLIGSAVVVGSTPFFLYVVKLDTDVSSLAQGIAYGVALMLVVSFRPMGILPEGVTRGRRSDGCRERRARSAVGRSGAGGGAAGVLAEPMYRPTAVPSWPSMSRTTTWPTSSRTGRCEPRGVSCPT